MKRSTWVAVLVTAAILVVAGNLPRVPFAAIAAGVRAGLEHRSAAWPHLARRPHAALSAPVAGNARFGAPAAAVRPSRHALVPVAPARLLATPMPSRSAGPFSRPWIPSLPLQVLLPALAGVLAGLVALVALGLALRRDRRGHVWQLARRGLSPSRIARTTRVPQDAVRTLLTPGMGARR